MAGVGACMAVGAYMAGGMHSRWGLCGRRDSHCSGQYTACWNAFLFIFYFWQLIGVVLVVAIGFLPQHFRRWMGGCINDGFA